MTAPDPHLTSAREALRRSHADMRAAIERLPAEALNWRPAGEDSNSLAVLAVHTLTSTRQWLLVALDEPLPPRDRDAEFEATAEDAGDLLAFVDDMMGQCLSLVDRDRAVDWAALRRHWDPGDDLQVSAAWALVHALEHVREHVGQMGLTRQLWERQAPGS